MKILYHINSLDTVYAARFIHDGYKDAFEARGHTFYTYTANDDLNKMLDLLEPDVFLTSLNTYNLKYLDLNLMKKHRIKRGMVLLTQIMPWKKQNSQFGGGDLESSAHLIRLIKDGLAGDIFHHWLEQDDPSMAGFEKETGYKFHTILLAANDNIYFPEFESGYAADISFVGNNLPDKRDFIKSHVKPLMKKYNVKIYGNDWTIGNQILGYIQKGAQYLNIKPLTDLRKIKLPINDERKVYNSSTISINFHENHQRKYGSDFNERTFKIIASKGFEICDNIKVLRKYFNEDELVLAENTYDWFEKIDYYIKNPGKRSKIIENGYKKVIEKHTYKNRVDQIVYIYNKYKKNEMSNLW